MGGFWSYLKNEKGITLNTIEFLISKFGEDISEEKIQRILKLLDTLKVMNIDVKYLNENNQIFDIMDIEDEYQYEETLMYVISYATKKKKSKTPYVFILLLIAAKQIRENKKEEEAERIIDLLEKEKLYFVFESKNPLLKEILYKSSYDTILKNITSLRKVDNYMKIIKNNPLILVTLTVKDLEKLTKQKLVKDEKKSEINEDNKSEELQTEDEEEIEDEFGERDRLLELGEESKVKQVLDAFNKYAISYSILVSNPDILRRRKLYQVPEILDLFYMNNISFSILYRYPEILEVCKTEDVEDIINELKNNNLSLTILITQPEILLKSSGSKIKNVIDVLEKTNVNKYIVYTFPDILIDGNLDILAESYDVNATKIKDINDILNVTQEKYVYFEDFVYNDSKKKKEIASLLGQIAEVTVINDTFNAKNNLDLINIKKGNDLIKENPNILNVSYTKTEQIFTIMGQNSIEKSIIEKDIKVLENFDVKKSVQIVDLLKKEMPEKYNKVIEQVPSLLYKRDAKELKAIFKVLESHNISKSFVEENPKILLQQDDYNLDSIIEKLQKNNFTVEEIIKQPSILVYGKEKYLKRNIETFKRNYLDLPLSLVYVISARNNEKNIDTLIEYNMYEDIKQTPEILAIKNSTLMQRLKIATERDIDIKDKEKLNLEYFMLSDEKLAEKYNLKSEYVKTERSNAETKEKTLRRVLDSDLYDGFFPILSKQAFVVLKDYENDNVSYKKNGKIVSKQKVIRETYLDVEGQIAMGGRKELKKLSTEKILNDKIEELTLGKKIISKEYEER